MFEDLDLNVTEPKAELTTGWYPPTYPIICNGPTSRRWCSETSGKYCC